MPSDESKRSEGLTDQLLNVIESEYSPHPFRDRVTPENCRAVLAQYAAMSEAFPYLQAGSQRRLIEDVISRRAQCPVDHQITSVVANFLTADETGVNFVLSAHGITALSRILDTGEYFHASLLKRDLVRLFGEPVLPDYSDATCTYLLALLEDLSHLDPVHRVAAMVAFESHAGRMIESLWNRLEEIFPIPKEELIYFRVHVGGDDPAEPYHVEMTSRMITRLVPADRADAFVVAFRNAYDLNNSWCRGICEIR